MDDDNSDEEDDDDSSPQMISRQQLSSISASMDLGLHQSGLHQSKKRAKKQLWLSAKISRFFTVYCGVAVAWRADPFNWIGNMFNNELTVCRADAILHACTLFSLVG